MYYSRKSVWILVGEKRKNLLPLEGPSFLWGARDLFGFSQKRENLKKKTASWLTWMIVVFLFSGTETSGYTHGKKNKSNNHEPTTIRCYVLRSVARCGQGMFAVSYRVVDDGSLFLWTLFLFHLFFFKSHVVYFLYRASGLNFIDNSLGYSHLLHTFTLKIYFLFKWMTTRLIFFICSPSDHRHTQLF